MRSWTDKTVLAILIYIFLVSLFTLTYSGTFRVDDEHILAARTQSLALWGRFSNPQVYGNDRVRALEALPPISASQASAIEPGQTILGAGLYGLAKILGVGGTQAAFTLNLFITALTGSVIFLIVCVLGYRSRTAVVTALLFGTATMAWPYAKTFYRDPLAMFMVALAFLGWSLTSVSINRLNWAGWVLVIIGSLGAILSKNIGIALLPAFALSSIVDCISSEDRSRCIAQTIALWFLIGLLIFTLYSVIPKRSPFARYTIDYLVDLMNHFLSSLDISLIPAMLGPFLSPAKSIFLFSPILLLVPLAISKYWSRHRRIILPVLLFTFFLVLGQALFYREMWAGSFGWSLRYMLPVIPVMVTLCAPIIREFAHGRTVLLKIGWGILIGVSLLIQLAGSSVSWYMPYQEWLDRGWEPFSVEAVWSARFLAIPTQIKNLIGIKSGDISWARTLPVDAWAIIIPFTAIGVGILCLVLLRKFFRDSPVKHSLPRQVLLLGLIAVVLPIYPSLLILKQDPSTGGNQGELWLMLSEVEDVQPADLVVVDSYGTSLWHFMMNHWTTSVPWYSLPFEIPGAPGVGISPGGPPSDAAVKLFEKVGQDYQRLWYLSSDQASGNTLRQDVTWLDKNMNLTLTMQFKFMHQAEIRLYEP
jgi:hypothetical protein